MAASDEQMLCIEPMTAGYARYQEGRQAGLLEAAERAMSALEGEECDCSMGLPLGTDIQTLDFMARCMFCRVRIALAGEP